MAELRIDLNVVLTVTGYVRLCLCLNHFYARIRPNTRNDGSAHSWWEEYGTVLNPGKKLRKCLSRKRRKQITIGTLPTTLTFFRLIDIDFNNDYEGAAQISAWSCSGINNRIRTFLFRFFNNLLGLNTRLSHFVENHDRACTFCTVSGSAIRPDESFKHLFFTCPTMKHWHGKFIEKYFPQLQQMSESEQVAFWFLGRVQTLQVDNMVPIYCDGQPLVSIFYLGRETK